MRPETAAAAAGESDLLSGRHELTCLYVDAVSPEVKVAGAMAMSVIEDNEICQPLAVGVLVGLGIANLDDDAVESGEGGHADILLVEGADVTVLSGVTIVRVLRAIPVEDAAVGDRRGTVDVDEVVDERVAPEIGGEGKERIRAWARADGRACRTAGGVPWPQSTMRHRTAAVEAAFSRHRHRADGHGEEHDNQRAPVSTSVVEALSSCQKAPHPYPC